MPTDSVPSNQIPSSRITVGYRATDAGADGVALAVELATAVNAQIDLVCVVRNRQQDAFPGRASYEQLLVKQAAEWLDEARSLIPHSLTVTTSTPLAESFAEGLMQFAQTTRARMIVVGGSSDGLLGAHTLGPVSSELMHYSPVPIALAPAGHRTRFAPVTRVVIAVPSSPSSDTPLPFGLSLAITAGVPVQLVTSISDTDEDPVADPASLAARQYDARAAAQILEQVRTSVANSPVDIDAIVADGATLTESLQALRWGPGELVVIGSGRLASQGRVFLGPTAARIMRKITTPIIAVPKAFT